MTGAHTAVLALLATGCWKGDFAEIPADVLRFAPDVAVPQGWLVLPMEVGLKCPDDSDARFYLVYPDGQPLTEPIPAALVFHSGSMDFVFAPDPADPLAGTHFATPSRLTGEWAFRQVFTTLGMYPAATASEIHTGRLPATLADAGRAMLLPANCWGDLWASRRGNAENDVSRDFFYREGRIAAEWAYLTLTDPAFAAAFVRELPITVDPNDVVAVGLGEGGRAVMELLSIDNDEDGVGDYTLAGALVDSSLDDLGVYYDDPALYNSRVQGLERIFPTGPQATSSGSVWAAPVLPDPFIYVYPTDDPRLPGAINDAAVAALEGLSFAEVREVEIEAHVLLNGADPSDLVTEVVDTLVSGG